METKLGFFRPAVDSDIHLIEQWLKEQSAGCDSLYVNWNVTLQVYEERGIFVYEDAESKEPVAYFWGSLNSTSSILEVRLDRRGQGIGRAVVAELLEMAVASGEGLLWIDCAPSSSEPFWRKMGFDIEVGSPRSSAKRILHIPRSIPSSAVPVNVIVRFFNEEALYSNGVSPLAEYSPSAAKDENGTIWLSAKLAHLAVSRTNCNTGLMNSDVRTI
jgi:GNAT superfamily N-acetyltransferase